MWLRAGLGLPTDGGLGNGTLGSLTEGVIQPPSENRGFGLPEDSRDPLFWWVDGEF